MNMRHTLVSFVLLLAACQVVLADGAVESLLPHQAESGVATVKECAEAEAWFHSISGPDQGGPRAHCWLGTGVPFSFRVDGKPWTPARHRCSERIGIDTRLGVEQRDSSWTDPNTGLKIAWQARRFLQYPAVEWLLTLENTGRVDSPLVEDVQNLDLRIGQSDAKKPFVVYGAAGGRCLPDDLMEFSVRLEDENPNSAPTLQLVRQDYEKLEANRSILQTPLKIGARTFEHGIGTHSVSRLVLRSPRPIAKFASWVGVDHNERTHGGAGSVVFSVAGPQGELVRSAILRGGQEAVRVEIDAKGARQLHLNVDDAGDGPTCDHADWAEATIALADGKTLRLGDLPRTPSNVALLGSQWTSSNEQMPFFNLVSSEDRGVLVGLGWTGAWRAEIVRNGPQLHARAGLPQTRFRLRPGEKVRGPRVLALLWHGPRLHGHNMLRGLLYRHYLPHLPGKPHEPMVSVNLCFTHHGKGGFLEAANQQSVLALLEPFAKLGAETFVIDAGWYKCKQWGDIMTHADFAYDPAKYPQGFRPLAEAYRKRGMDFGLWFPPEAYGSFEKPETVRRFVDMVSGYVQRDGISMYRQDGGLLPSAKEPDRQGVSEMQHIAGLYAMQDALRSRFPHLVMEGCCGGGRRIDLESLSRFLWHQKSDKWFDTLSDHCGLHGANMFLPGGVINVPTEATDDFGVWSSFGGQLCLAWHPLDKDFPMEKARRQVELYKQVRRFLSGDFYPLTECSLSAPWLAYQFHRRDLDGGFALAFRRNAKGSSVLKIALRGLEPDRRYTVHLEAARRELTATGRALAAGIDVSLAKAPGAELIRYRLGSGD